MKERPIECSGCQRPADHTYKMISKNGCHKYSVCSQCPFISPQLDSLESDKHKLEESLTCPHCHTTLAMVMETGLVGCKECYALFADAIVDRLGHSKHLPAHLVHTEQQSSDELFHVGQTPLESASSEASHQLEGLHRALNEAVECEHYEQAAALRDKIQQLMGRKHGS